MFTTEDHGTEKLADRAIAAAIAAVCGWPIGLLLAHSAAFLFGRSFGLAWILPFGFALFGFLAPIRSRDLLTTVWTGILDLIGKLLDTRRFYR